MTKTLLILVIVAPVCSIVAHTCTAEEDRISVEAVQMLLSEHLEEQRLAQQRILQERADTIAQLVAIIAEPDNHAQHSLSVRRSMSILGELRAREGIKVLVAHIGYPYDHHPEAEAYPGPPVTMGALAKTVDELLPAVPALIEIGEPCIDDVVNRLATADSLFAIRACQTVLIRLGQRHSVRVQLERGINVAMPGKREQLRKTLEILDQDPAARVRLFQPLWAGSTEEADQEKADFLQDRDRVRSWGDARDLASLEQAAQELHAKWARPDRDKTLYGLLMLEIVQPFLSERFYDKTQYPLAHKYALLALKHADEIPIWIEWDLVRHLWVNLTPPHIPEGAQWGRQRTEELKYWFHAYKRLSDAIDPNWDPGQVDFVFPSAVPLPAGVNTGTSGMASSAIQDPILRAEYERAIEENSNRATRYRDQKNLRKLKERFFPRAERYIIAAYSHPPYNLPELEARLQEYVADKTARFRILNAVRANMD